MYQYHVSSDTDRFVSRQHDVFMKPCMDFWVHPTDTWDSSSLIWRAGLSVQIHWNRTSILASDGPHVRKARKRFLSWQSSSRAGYLVIIRRIFRILCDIIIGALPVVEGKGPIAISPALPRWCHIRNSVLGLGHHLLFRRINCLVGSQMNTMRARLLFYQTNV